MTSLAAHQSSESTKLLLMGNSGSGKTGALTSLIKREPLTQKYLHSLINYNFITGLMYWLDPKRAKKPNGLAGCISSQGYWTLRIDYKLYQSHDLIWLYVYDRFPFSGFEIDHEDKTRSNNAFDNLRELTRSYNNMNSSPRSNTGAKGVTYIKGRKRPFMAQASLDCRHITIGYYSSAEEAHAAYISYMKSRGVPDDFLS